MYKVYLDTKAWFKLDPSVILHSHFNAIYCLNSCFYSFLYIVQSCIFFSYQQSSKVILAVGNLESRQNLMEFYHLVN